MYMGIWILNRVKLLYLASLLMLFISLFGEGLIAKLRPDYHQFNKVVLEKTFKTLDKKNQFAVDNAIILYIESNEFYARVKRMSNAIAFIGFVLLFLGTSAWFDYRIQRIEKKLR